ncbi:small ribosomal subunit protein mS86 (rPPR1)-like [Miscanthus floridulus]|uniref:small ribosomal subunit protein mS86 (rPPR1)-like n=1 Tax=Miscanthus floridulus TaxID=154761 RepID=UPI00345B3C3D
MAAAVRHIVRRRLSTAANTTPVPTPGSILNPSSPSTPLTSREKTRLAISLLKSSPPPPHDQILSICRAAALTPENHIDRIALSLAASKLSSAPDTLRDLASTVLTPRHAPHAIVLFGQANLLPDAISTFQSSPSTRSLNALIFACIVSGNHNEAARVFQTFPDAHGVKPNIETFNAIIKSFAESGTIRSFYSVFDEMCKKGLKPNTTTFTTALAGFYKEEMFDDVGKVLELMKKNGCGESLPVYNVRVQSLCKLGRSGEARALVDEMVKKGTKPSWVTYNHLIYGFCKEGDLEEAKRLYKEMGRKGLVGDNNFYFMLIHYLCKGDDFDTALGLYNEIAAKNWVPCFSTMKMLVNGLAGSSRIDEAKGIIEKMKEKFPNKTEGWKELEEALPH